MYNFLSKILLGYQIKEDRVGGACNMHGNEEKCIHLVAKPEGERSFGKLGICGRMWI
jgi:hypothetical protein